MTFNRLVILENNKYIITHRQIFIRMIEYVLIQEGCLKIGGDFKLQLVYNKVL